MFSELRSFFQGKNDRLSENDFERQPHGREPQRGPAKRPGQQGSRTRALLVRGLLLVLLGDGLVLLGDGLVLLGDGLVLLRRGLVLLGDGLVLLRQGCLVLLRQCLIDVGALVLLGLLLGLAFVFLALL